MQEIERIRAALTAVETTVEQLQFNGIGTEIAAGVAQGLASSTSLSGGSPLQADVERLERSLVQGEADVERLERSVQAERARALFAEDQTQEAAEVAAEAVAFSTTALAAAAKVQEAATQKLQAAHEAYVEEGEEDVAAYLAKWREARGPGDIARSVLSATSLRYLGLMSRFCMGQAKQHLRAQRWEIACKQLDESAELGRYFQIQRHRAQRAWYTWLLQVRGRKEGDVPGAQVKKAEEEMSRLNSLVATLLAETEQVRKTDVLLLAPCSLLLSSSQLVSLLTRNNLLGLTESGTRPRSTAGARHAAVRARRSARPQSHAQDWEAAGGTRLERDRERAQHFSIFTPQTPPFRHFTHSTDSNSPSFC